MNGGRIKLITGILIISAAAGFLGYQSISESRSYYLFADEVIAMGEQAKNIRIKIHGSVVPGSVVKSPAGMTFDIRHNEKQIRVRYSGKNPVPDSFREGSPAIIDGMIGEDGVFDGKLIQAKCASKYEAEYSRINEKK